MAKEIFIQEWKISDYDGRRDKSIKSDGTINGDHVYACQRLSSWFRLGKYIIKHDVANYLLGLTRYVSRREFQHSVKCYDWDSEKKEGKYINCVNEIVSIANERFPDGDYLLTVLLMQEQLEGYEKCLYISQCYRLGFDYESFIRDRDAYQKRLEDYVQAEHERELKSKYPVYDVTATYKGGQIVLKDGSVYIFHNERFILVPKKYEWPLYLESFQKFVIEKCTIKPDSDELFLTIENYGYVDKEE